LKSKVEPRKVLRNKGAIITKLEKDRKSTKRYFRKHRTIKLGEILKSNITKRNAKE
jgi:TFIIF-interacting CTD phosphatase-like protein